MEAHAPAVYAHYSARIRARSFVVGHLSLGTQIINEWLVQIYTGLIV